VAVTIALIAVTTATLLLVVADGGGVLRVVLGLVTALLVPGWAVLRLLRLEADAMTQLGLAVAISTTIDILIVLPLFYLRVWSIELAVVALTLVILGLIAFGIPFIRRGVGQRAREAVAALNRGGFA
jgi:uncharacterized membrane protein